MTNRGRIAVPVLALAVGVVIGASLAIWTPRIPTPLSAPAPSPSASASTPTPGPVPRPTPSRSPSSPTVPIPRTPARPPATSIHVADRYLASYRAVRVGWERVLAAGRPLPGVTDRCRDRWRTSGKDARLDWKSATFMCMDRLAGLAYRPQGVAGSATTRDYRIGGRPAADRNIVLTSWYSGVNEPGLVAPNRLDQSVTRLVIMDLDRRRYTSVELVRPDGPDRLRNLNSHGSGLVWAGQYLYSSSRSSLWMYNADDILEIGGRFVLPAVAAWSVDGLGGLSSISLDRSTNPARMTAINYSKAGEAHIQSFALEPSGLLARHDRRTRRSLSLVNSFGENRRVVHSVDSLTIPGSSFQGVATVGPYGLANSSALRFDGLGPVDATVVLEDGEVIGRFRMPRGNVESIYIDETRGRYVSITELGSQFLFALPLNQLTAG